MDPRPKTCQERRHSGCPELEVQGLCPPVTPPDRSARSDAVPHGQNVADFGPEGVSDARHLWRIQISSPGTPEKTVLIDPESGAILRRLLTTF